MRALQLNSVYGVGSTGRIVRDIELSAAADGVESYVAYGLGAAPVTARHHRMQSSLAVRWSIMQTRLSGRHGFYNVNATRRLLAWITKVDPDVIHLHNIHGHYIDIKQLFEYLHDANKPVIWTFHDCWPFTGHCAYFDFVGCEKWKTGCHHCPQRREYPDSWFFDRSRRSYEQKQRLFTSIQNMTIVTPSEWLADLVSASFLWRYPTRVINNGIDLTVFKPSPSDFRARHGLRDKFIVLGVAAGFERRKGIAQLARLSIQLGDDEVMLLVGATKEQSRSLPGSIITIPRTDNAAALAEIYSAADVFVNPTLEDNFPTVNLEALACGTPVVTFASGGSAESVDPSTGVVVRQGDDVGLRDAVALVRLRGSASYQEACVSRARTMYDAQRAGAEYLRLYQEMAISERDCVGKPASAVPYRSLIGREDEARR